MSMDMLGARDGISLQTNDMLADAFPGRLAGIDWSVVEAALAWDGFPVLPQILTAQECQDAVSIYDHEQAFRSRIVMERYAFGRGEYKYFKYPLPGIVQSLRT